MRNYGVPAGQLVVSVTTLRATSAEAASRRAGSGAGGRGGRAHAHAHAGMLAARRVQVVASWSAEEFAAAAAAALDVGVAEPQTLQRVAAARGLPPPAA